MLKIGFTGDVSFSGTFAREDWTIESIDPDVLRFLRDSDHLVVNLEGPLTSVIPENSGLGVRLSSPDRHVTTLTRMGCTILNLANNHVLDCGFRGLSDTVGHARQAEILHQGAGGDLAKACAPLVVCAGDVSAALIAFTVDIGQGASQRRGGTCSGLSPRQYKEMIQQSRRIADWVIVQYHGGDEFVKLPCRRQIRLLRRFVDWGADIVICHHGHVIRPYEKYSRGLIFYGLGNFIFDIPGHRGFWGTTDSALVQVTLTKTEKSFAILGTRFDRDTSRIVKTNLEQEPPELNLSNYRYRYCRAVYDACYWPQVPRAPSGAPDPNHLRGQRESFRRRVFSVNRWKRHVRALLQPVERRRMLAMAEYRLRKRLRFDRRKRV